MKKFKIGIDLDSVLNDLLTHWLHKYNEDYGDNLKSTDIHIWEMNLIVKKECGKKIFDCISSPGFFRNLPVIKDSQRVTEWLSTFDEIELYVVTAYTSSVCKDKADWLVEHFPHIKTQNIIFCNDKSLINLDYLIDDSPYNFIGFKGEYIVYDYPYNQCLKDKFTRVCNWNEIQDYFRNILDNKITKI